MIERSFVTQLLTSKVISPAQFLMQIPVFESNPTLWDTWYDYLELETNDLREALQLANSFARAELFRVVFEYVNYREKWAKLPEITELIDTLQSELLCYYLVVHAPLIERFGTWPARQLQGDEPVYNAQHAHLLLKLNPQAPAVELVKDILTRGLNATNNLKVEELDEHEDNPPVIWEHEYPVFALLNIHGVKTEHFLWTLERIGEGADFDFDILVEYAQPVFKEHLPASEYLELANNLSPKGKVMFWYVYFACLRPHTDFDQLRASLETLRDYLAEEWAVLAYHEVINRVELVDCPALSLPYVEEFLHHYPADDRAQQWREFLREKLTAAK